MIHYLAIILAPVVCCLFASRTLLHYFQLESYQFPGYFRTLKRNWRHSLLPGVCAAVASCVVVVLFALFGFNTLIKTQVVAQSRALWMKALFSVLMLLVSAGCGIAIARLFNNKRAKKPFVKTDRVKRL